MALQAEVVVPVLVADLQHLRDLQTLEQEERDGIQYCLHLHMELQDQLRDIDIFLAAVVAADIQAAPVLQVDPVVEVLEYRQHNQELQIPAAAVVANLAHLLDRELEEHQELSSFNTQNKEVKSHGTFRTDRLRKQSPSGFSRE